MMEQYEDELSEIIVYVSSLRRTFNRKLDDHLFIIEQQRERIELQQHLFDEQRTVIDELAWQIRDLRDSVRQCCEKMAEFEMNQTRRNNEAATSSAVHSADYDNADNHSRGRLQRQGHVVLEDGQYESIYDNVLPNRKPTAAQRARASSLKRQSAVDHESDNSSCMRVQNIEKTSDDNNDKRRTRYVRPAPTIPSLPPPPASQDSTAAGDGNHASSALAQHQRTNVPFQQQPSAPSSSLCIPSSNLPLIKTSLLPSAETLAVTTTAAKSSTSYIIQTNQDEFASPMSPKAVANITAAINRPDSIKQDNIDIRDSIDEYNDELGDIIYRLRQFKDFSTRSNRGSSKNVCSLISDIEGDYLPRDDGDDDDENGVSDRMGNDAIERQQNHQPQSTTYIAHSDNNNSSGNDKQSS